MKFQKSKVRDPFEQMTFTLRILDAEVSDEQLKVATEDSTLAGMDLFQFPDPTGESELGFDWAHTMGLLERLKWIHRVTNPETVQESRFSWSPDSFVSRYELTTRNKFADFFIQLIHPEGILDNQRSLALSVFDDALAAKAEALVAFLLSLPLAVQQ